MLTDSLLALLSLFVVVIASGWTAYVYRLKREIPERKASQGLPVRFHHLFLLAGSVAACFVFVAATSSSGSLQAGTNAPNRPASTVTLPLKVMGTDQTTGSMTVRASDVSDVDSLYLKAHSIGYPGHKGYDVNKASIRLNGGSWVDLTDAIATCKFPESRFECIDGPYATIRFEVAVSDVGSLQDGSNTISFRFNYVYPKDSPDSHGAVSSGYRILDLEFRNDTDEDAIDGTDFVWTDPGTWAPPEGYDTQTAIDEGANLWSSRDILVEHWGGTDIRASCADCHAEDGRDLAYFAFSNESIIERSKFHGLSAEQGKKIAAYIRTRVLEDPDTGTSYDPPGRPWAPPFQPGPTARGTRAEDSPRTNGQPFDAVSSQLWAAGAGLDWVLDRDEDMWPYVKGPDRTFSYEDVSVDATLNARQLPVNLQLPDWNEWLPEHHPIDLFGSAFTNGYGSGVDPNGAYTNTVGALEDCLAGNGGDATNCGDEYASAATDLYKNSRRFQQEVQKGNITPTSDYADLSVSKMASIVMTWQAAKQWEFTHQHDLSDEGEHWRAEVEPLTWIGDARQVFDIPPHISGAFAGSKKGAYDLYLDNAWYQMQTIVNSGRGIGTFIRPNDWRYQFSHIKGLYKDLGLAHSMRFIATFVKVNQNCDVDGLYQDSDPKSWFFRRGHCDFGAEMLRRPWVYPKVDEVTGGQALTVYEEILRANFRGFGKYPTDSWTRQYGEGGWEPADFTPSLNHAWYRDSETPSHYYKTLNQMAQRGASTALLDSIARWGEKMNPNGDWEQWMTDGSTDNKPSITLTAPSAGASFTAPADVSLSADASDSDGSVRSVTFYADGTQIAEASSAPYDVTWTNVAAGSYSLTAKATDDAGQTATSSAVGITVSTEGTSASSGTSYTYYEGDWSQLPDFGSLTPKSTGTTSNFTLSVRERDKRFALRFVSYVDVPASETGTYTFYTSSDDGSRLLINGREVVNNDGVHGITEKSGTVSLSEGWHKVVVEFFEKTGGEALTVSWKGPSFSKEEIPDNRLYQSPVTLSSQNIALESGWNVISSSVAPDTAALETVFADVSVDIVKDEAGNTYVPTDDLNEIGAWDSTEAYRVYTGAADQTLTIEGSAVADTVAIPLSQGWNLVPYLPGDAKAVATALQSISSELVIVKDDAGNTYVPAYGIDEIGTLKPTEGYQVYVDSAVDLVYPDGSTQTSHRAGTTTGFSNVGRDNR
jgi:hypothetical protein